MSLPISLVFSPATAPHGLTFAESGILSRLHPVTSLAVLLLSASVNPSEHWTPFIGIAFSLCSPLWFPLLTKSLLLCIAESLPRVYNTTVYFAPDELAELRGCGLYEVTLQRKGSFAAEYRILHELVLVRVSCVCYVDTVSVFFGLTGFVYICTYVCL